MSKKTAGGLLGTILIAGVAVGVAKYLKDYAGASYTREEELDNVRESSSKVKDAAKRTYIAIREKGDVRGAAGDLARAAGDMAADAGSIAKTAGTGAIEAAKSVKASYDEDPEGTRDVIKNNIRDMGMNIADTARDYADTIRNMASEKVEELKERGQDDEGTAEDAVSEAEAADEEPAEDSVKSDTVPEAVSAEEADAEDTDGRIDIDFSDAEDEEPGDKAPAVQISDEG